MKRNTNEGYTAKTLQNTANCVCHNQNEEELKFHVERTFISRARYQFKQRGPLIMNHRLCRLCIAL